MDGHIEAPASSPDLAFTPAAPIQTTARLHGRTRHLEQASAVLREPGRHLLVLGEPGVGRTSFCLSLAEGLTVRYHTVGLDDRFDVLVERLLYSAQASKEEATRTPWAAIDLPAGTVLIIDDLDRGEAPSLQAGVLPLIRALAAPGASAKLVLVARHDRPLPPALADAGLRLHALALERLGETALRAIVEQGARTTGLTFDDPLRDRVVLDSDGLPGFVHALCLEASRSALRAGRHQVRLGTDYLPALQAVVESLGPALQSRYAAATSRRSRHNRYAHLVWAAAACPESRFGLPDLVEGLSRIEGRHVVQQGFAPHLGDLLRRGFLARLPDGRYRFADPAMRAYVRLRLRHEHPTLLGEDPLQLALPY